jgi:surfeit locus 1 family protein
VTTTPPDASTAHAPLHPDDFPPTLREVMLRPSWIAMLGLCLVVAGLFAWLGQWQLSRAIDTSPQPAGATEQVEPIADVVQPGAYLANDDDGQRVSVSGTWVPGDFLIVSGRFDDGERGFWVTGQLRVDPVSVGAPAGQERPSSLAVALGWTADRAVAEAAAAAMEQSVAAQPEASIALTGRIISDEGPALPPSGADPFEMTHMAPAALLSRWHDTEVPGGGYVSVYRAFLTAADVPAAAPGLAPIHSPAPEVGSSVNWLNIFYAAEWLIFAGFAFYLWYRLARDAWEKELEDREERLAAAS